MEVPQILKREHAQDLRASLLIIYPKEAEWVYFLKYLFIWLQWALVVDHEICFASSRTSHCGPGGSGGCWLCLCGTWAYLLCCMWDLISPTKDWTRIESPLWQGRFLTWNSCDHQECPMKNQYSKGVTCIRITIISLFTTIHFSSNNTVLSHFSSS